MCDDDVRKKPNEYRSALGSVARCASHELTELGKDAQPGRATTVSEAVNDPETWDTPTVSGDYATTVSETVAAILAGITSARDSAQEDHDQEPETVEVPGDDAWKAFWGNFRLY